MRIRKQPIEFQPMVKRSETKTRSRKREAEFDILVNNAGIGQSVALEEITKEKPLGYRQAVRREPRLPYIKARQKADPNFGVGFCLHAGV
ncbi:hypothetical protein ACLBWT_16795 [Paenibacillus sp. D51F]